MERANSAANLLLSEKILEAPSLFRDLTVRMQRMPTHAFTDSVTPEEKDKSTNL